MKNREEKVASSFRDPSGYLFKQNNVLFRRVNKRYKQDYDTFISSGLYDALSSRGLLVDHSELPARDEDTYKVLQPTVIPFISYPYEWSFPQLKDAALLTLQIQELALEHNMTLKDASAFNVGFRSGSPIFIDTLSFEQRKDEPWVAYGQFCRHFLAPLLLMKHDHPEMIKLFSVYLDGIPLSLASRLLPWTTYFNIGKLLHVHMHARSIRKHEATRKVIHTKFDLKNQKQLVAHLKQTVSSLALKSGPDESHWENYYQVNSYSKEQLDQKIALCRNYLQHIKPESVWDLGCNTGWVSRVAAEMNITTVAMDNDHECIRQLYLNCKGKGLPIYPIHIELNNPSSGCGWSGIERASLEERGPADLAFALALIHHLVISANVPMSNVAVWLRKIVSRYLIIEFVPKTDPQVVRLLLNRKDVFDYSQNIFESGFSEFFNIENSSVLGSGRVIYLMRAK